MGEPPRREWVYRILAVAEFVLGLSTFFSTWLIYDLPILSSVLIAMMFVTVLFLVFEIASRFTLHSRYLAPLRKCLLRGLSGVNIEKWIVVLEIDEDGNALVTNVFSGQVNFGNAQWINLAAWAGKEQPKGKNFRVDVFDVLRQTQQEPELIFNEGKQKKIRVRFGHVLKRGERFHFRIQYKLFETFYFGREDYYDFEAVHHEKEIRMKVSFPENVKVEYARGEIITEHGDVWEEHEKANIVNSQTIEWRIRNALDGNHHKLCWKAKKKTPNSKDLSPTTQKAFIDRQQNQ